MRPLRRPPLSSHSLSTPKSHSPELDTFHCFSSFSVKAQWHLYTMTICPFQFDILYRHFTADDQDSVLTCLGFACLYSSLGWSFVSWDLRFSLRWFILLFLWITFSSISPKYAESAPLCNLPHTPAFWVPGFHSSRASLRFHGWGQLAPCRLLPCSHFAEIRCNLSSSLPFIQMFSVLHLVDISHLLSSCSFFVLINLYYNVILKISSLSF